MIKRYKFNYDNGKAEVVLDVDLEKFTEQMALDILEFFTWYYNESNNVIDEVMKKYALECIIIADKKDYNIIGVCSELETQEGFYSVSNFEYGLKLIFISTDLDLEDDLLEVTIEVKSGN